MKVFSVKNKAGYGLSVAASSADRACEIAAEVGHVRKKENARATDQTDWWQEHRPDDLTGVTEGPMVSRVSATTGSNLFKLGLGT